MNIYAVIIVACITSACSSETTTSPFADDENHHFAERPQLSTAQCNAMSGVVVSDPGDGRVHRANYVCESGKPPLGTIRFEDGEPIAIEGSVCCSR